MFNQNWKFAERHLPEIQRRLMMLPSGVFLEFNKADIQMDLEEATDLIVNIAGGTMAVRVRSRRHWDFAVRNNTRDWSVRYKNKDKKTEIHKLREGFGDWYFYGYSSNDQGLLIAWWLFDLAMIRNKGILNDRRIGKTWPIYPNNDGTSGLYIPIRILEDERCIIHCEYGTQSNQRMKIQRHLSDQQTMF